MIHEVDFLSDLDQLRSRYDILRQLGRDGAFAVYGARIRGSDRHIAVSVVRDPGGRRVKSGALRLWQAHTVERLEHPKLMPLHAVHHLQGGAIALAMERRRGRPLAELIDEDGPLPIATVDYILRDIAEALAYLHTRGVVHRGVRPHSIFLDRDSGHARLAYFGIDHIDTTAGLTGDRGAIFRQLAYLPPEQLGERAPGEPAQIEGRGVSARSDLYSLGLVGYAMLTGKQPREGAADGLIANQRSASLPPLTTLRRDAPPSFCSAIGRCLEENPRRRWRTADEFLAALDPPAEGARWGLLGGSGSDPAEGATSEEARSGPAADLTRLLATLEHHVAHLRVTLSEQWAELVQGKLALVVLAAVLVLVTLTVLWAGDDRLALVPGDQGSAPSTEWETSPTGSDGAHEAGADTVVPGGISGAADSAPADLSSEERDTHSTAGDGSAPTAAARRPSATPTRDQRPLPTPEVVAPNTVVLLGEAISLPTPPTLLGEVVQPGRRQPEE